MTEEIIAENVNNYLQDSEENRDTGAVFEENNAPEAESASEVSDGVDYAELIIKDAEELSSQFPELSGIKDITELENPLRYAALRDLGLSAAEAYLATSPRRRQDNRAHLRPTRSVAKSASPLMTESEMSAARELFSDISDSQIRQLYKRVTKQ